MSAAVLACGAVRNLVLPAVILRCTLPAGHPGDHHGLDGDDHYTWSRP